MAVWCRKCKAPAKRTSPGIQGTGVHAGDEPEDGHTAVLTDEDPVLRAEADKIEAEFPGFTVSVRFGFFRADWANLPAGTVAQHYSEADADTLRHTLGIVTRPRP